MTHNTDAVLERLNVFLSSQLHKQQPSAEKPKTDTSIKWIRKQWSEGILKPIFIWMIWLVIGAIFYGNVDFDGNYSKGFYYAVNVGYSIGWGVLHDQNNTSKIFSVFYLLIGATAISGWLVYVIEHFYNRNKEDVFEVINRERFFASYRGRFGILSSVHVYLLKTLPKVPFLIAWLLFVIFGSAWSCCIIGWSPIDGLYFATSSLSTGGLWGIPFDSPDWVFVFVGIFASTGVPVTGMAMADIAGLVIDYNKYSRLKNAIATKMSDWEIDMIDVDSVDGKKFAMTKYEFLLFTLLRLNIVDVELIDEVFEGFARLDVSRTGWLSYEEFFDSKTHKQDQQHQVNNHTNTHTTGTHSRTTKQAPSSSYRQGHHHFDRVPPSPIPPSPAAVGGGSGSGSPKKVKPSNKNNTKEVIGSGDADGCSQTAVLSTGSSGRGSSSSSSSVGRRGAGSADDSSIHIIEGTGIIIHDEAVNALHISSVASTGDDGYSSNRRSSGGRRSRITSQQQKDNQSSSRGRAPTSPASSGSLTPTLLTTPIFHEHAKRHQEREREMAAHTRSPSSAAAKVLNPMHAQHYFYPTEGVSLGERFYHSAVERMRSVSPVRNSPSGNFSVATPPTKGVQGASSIVIEVGDDASSYSSTTKSPNGGRGVSAVPPRSFRPSTSAAGAANATVASIDVQGGRHPISPRERGRGGRPHHGHVLNSSTGGGSGTTTIGAGGGVAGTTGSLGVKLQKRIETMQALILMSQESGELTAREQEEQEEEEDDDSKGVADYDDDDGDDEQEGVDAERGSASGLIRLVATPSVADTKAAADSCNLHNHHHHHPHYLQQQQQQPRNHDDHQYQQLDAAASYSSESTSISALLDNTYPAAAAAADC